MRSVIVPLYWLWCGVSVFILVRRRINGKTRQTTATPSADSPGTSTSFIRPVPDDAPRLEREPVAAMVAAPTTADGAYATAPEQPAAATAPERPAATAAAAVRLGVPLSTVDSLAEALEGITLPCDLAPLIGTGEFDRRALVLVTSGIPDEIVGTELADELERLGYALEPLGERSILATSDRASVEIAVYSDSEVVDDSGTRRFPTAPPNAIVVDIRLR